MQVKNVQKTISIEEKLDVISQLGKGGQVVDICCNVRFTYIRIPTNHNSADKITESAKLGTKLPQSYQNGPYHNYGCESLTFLLR